MRSLVIVHDSPSIQYVTQDICLATFVIYCKVTKQRCKGSVVKKSKDADNYRAQILGGVVVRLVLWEASHNTQVEYNNLRVVNHGGTLRQGLKENQVQVDVLCCFK